MTRLSSLVYYLRIRQGAYPRVEHLRVKGISLGKALFLPANMTRLERLARDKHTSILGIFANYSCKKFYDNVPVFQC